MAYVINVVGNKMNNEINIFINSKKIIVDSKKIEKFVDSILINEQVDKKMVAISIIEDQEMQKLNFEYRDLDMTTDVLSFCYSGDELGEIYISADKVISQAIDLNHSQERELYFLITHGILHLVGYDHDNLNSEKIMIEKQNNYLVNMKR